MKFGTLQYLKFNSKVGTYSIVTDRENYDSQITLTDFETDLLISHFGRENILYGNVQSNPQMAKKKFKLFPQGKEIDLNVVFPKTDKSELRLYISTRAGFKPKGGQIWFLFEKEKDLWIGATEENDWRSTMNEYKQDDYDDIYQNLVNETNEIKISRLKSRDIFSRNRKIALTKQKIINYKCEFDQKHNLFISRFNGKPYLESHHLIPIGLQKEFSKSLDTIHNLFCLCPNCHRAIHHAENNYSRDIITALAEKSLVLVKYNISVPELYNYYAVEEIK